MECLSAARRNPALEDLLTTRVAGLGDHIAAGSLQADVFGAMIRKYHDAMLSGEMLQEARFSKCQNTNLKYTVLNYMTFLKI